MVLQQNKRTLNTKKPCCGLVFNKQEEFWRWSSFGRQEFCIAGVLMFPWGNVHGKRKNSFYTIDQFCWAQASSRGNAKNSNKKLGKLPLSHSSSRREPLLSDPLPRRPHASCYTVHILLRSVVTVFPLYFLLIWPFCQTAVGMRTILCTSTIYHGRGVRVLILGKSLLIWAILEITDQVSPPGELLECTERAEEIMEPLILKFNTFYCLLSKAGPLWICWHFKFYCENCLSISNIHSTKNCI